MFVPISISQCNLDYLNDCQADKHSKLKPIFNDTGLVLVFDDSPDLSKVGMCSIPPAI
jgi:hypothetical protein